MRTPSRAARQVLATLSAVALTTTFAGPGIALGSPGQGSPAPDESADHELADVGEEGPLADDAQPGQAAEPRGDRVEAYSGDARPGDEWEGGQERDDEGEGGQEQDAEHCDPLVTHAPTGSSGAVDAVAVTAQAIVAGVPGWERVGWEAAEGTTVTEVWLLRADGALEPYGGDDLRVGSAEHVLEVSFCGTLTASHTPGEEGDSTRGAGGDRADGGDTDGDAAGRSTSADSASPEGDVDEDGDVEVLGVALSADDTAVAASESGGTLPRTGLDPLSLAATGLLALLLGALALYGTRRLPQGVR
jgi:hypothetical protein